MKQNEARTISIVTLVISVIHLIASIIMIAQLPETVPTHFNIHWVCDGVGSRWSILLVAFLPLASSIFTLVWLRSKKDAPHPKLTAGLMLILALFMIVMLWMIYPSMKSGAGIGDQIDPQALSGILPLMYALMFIAVGNYLPVIQPNRNLGIRVSWTLHNEQCWRMTHRFAGKIWVISGLILCVVVLIAFLLHQISAWWLYVIFGEVLFVNIIVPCIYAWMHKDAGKEDPPA